VFIRSNIGNVDWSVCCRYCMYNVRHRHTNTNTHIHCDRLTWLKICFWTSCF